MLRAAGHISPHIKRSSTPNWNPAIIKKKNILQLCAWLLRWACQPPSRQAGGAGDARANKRVWAFLQQQVPERSWSWMSLPCDPEDCGECVSVTLIKSNTAAVGTCGQVNETQREADSSASPSPPGSCGLRDEVERLPSPTGRADTLFKAPLPKYGCICSCTLLHKSSVPVPRTWLFIIFILDSIGSTLPWFIFFKCVTTSWHQCNYPSFRNVLVKNDPCDQGWRKEFNFAKLTDPELVFTEMCPKYLNCKTFTKKLCVLLFAFFQKCLGKRAMCTFG